MERAKIIYGDEMAITYAYIKKEGKKRKHNDYLFHTV